MFSLNPQPLANNLMSTPNVDVEVFPLTLTQCPECGLVQLQETVEPKKLFDHYLYQSGTNKQFVEHFNELAEHILTLKPNLDTFQGYVLDVGSNDGTLLKALEIKDITAVGVEPARNLYKKTREKGFNVVHGYFDDPKVVKEIITKYGYAQVITACNVFAHVADIHGFIAGVDEILADGGVFIVEVVDFSVMADNVNFDMIYHEHLFHYTMTTLTALLAQHSFRLLKSYVTYTHGGSMRAIFERGPIRHPFIDDHTYSRSEVYAENVSYKIVEIKHKLNDLKGKRIVGYGAPAKATVLLNSIDWDIPKGFKIIEDNKLKQGCFLPVIRGEKINPIQLVSSSDIDFDNYDTIVIFAWNFADSIEAKCRSLGFKGEFLVLNI